ncbi:MAG TPA: hypothetical protein VF487_20535 [Chitinophagaceae bacterium]
MKNLRTYSLCVCMLLTGMFAFSQTPESRTNQLNADKPKLFSALPDNIPVDVSSFTGILTNEVGKSVSLGVTNSLRLQGQVVSASDQSDNKIKSVVVRLVNYPGARLTFSSAKDEKGNIIYTGRIISRDHSDLYELINQDGQYSFVKKNYYDLINE